MNKNKLAKFSHFIIFRTKVECGGQCVATKECTAFEFVVVNMTENPYVCPSFSKTCGKGPESYICRKFSPALMIRQYIFR